MQVTIGQKACFCQLEWIITGQQVNVSSVSECKFSFGWKCIIIDQYACFSQLEWIIIGQSELSLFRMQVILNVVWITILVRKHVFVSESKLSYGENECIIGQYILFYHQLEWIIIGQKWIIYRSECMFLSVRVNYHWWKWIIIGSECMFLSVRVNYHRSKWIISRSECKLFWSWCELPLVRKHVFVSESKLSLVKMNYQSVSIYVFSQLDWIIIGQSELSPVRMHVFFN